MKTSSSEQTPASRRQRKKQRQEHARHDNASLLGRLYRKWAGTRTFAVLQVVLICLAIAGWVAALHQIGKVWLIISAVAAIFLSFRGQSPNSTGYSAYSVFNPGCKSLLGDLRAEKMQREMGHVVLSEHDEDNIIDLPEELQRTSVPLRVRDVKSRDLNKPCPCGSGIKVKKCCLSEAKRR